MYITVIEMKRWLNIPFMDDDLTIAEMIEGAEDAIEQHIDRKLSDLKDASTNDIPASLKTAIKTLTANFYQNRESIAYGQPFKVPYSLEFLLQPWKNYDKD